MGNCDALRRGELNGSHRETIFPSRDFPTDFPRWIARDAQSTLLHFSSLRRDSDLADVAAVPLKAPAPVTAFCFLKDSDTGP